MENKMKVSKSSSQKKIINKNLWFKKTKTKIFRRR